MLASLQCATDYAILIKQASASTGPTIPRPGTGVRSSG
ncbi:hypothetical protein EYZ11_010601 [Aspergillus tanneri]|uniref:Uncharacterized protein n=1 Tax=Aspergillus tanneri TaxID=1220188 RepID=A0A4S3J4W7_9EURO|nr:hypothetical protein EYZ11_010601 [Aspergillus tanneri]